jgi:hypothetical protein
MNGGRDCDRMLGTVLLHARTLATHLCLTLLCVRRRPCDYDYYVFVQLHNDSCIMYHASRTRFKEYVSSCIPCVHYFVPPSKLVRNLST